MNQHGSEYDAQLQNIVDENERLRSQISTMHLAMKNLPKPESERNGGRAGVHYEKSLNSKQRPSRYIHAGSRNSLPNGKSDGGNYVNISPTEQKQVSTSDAQSAVRASLPVVVTSSHYVKKSSPPPPPILSRMDVRVQNSFKHQLQGDGKRFCIVTNANLATLNDGANLQVAQGEILELLGCINSNHNANGQIWRVRNVDGFAGNVYAGAITELSSGSVANSNSSHHSPNNVKIKLSAPPPSTSSAITTEKGQPYGYNSNIAAKTDHETTAFSTNRRSVESTVMESGMTRKASCQL